MRPTVLLTDNDLGDRELERTMLETELDARVVVADCRTEADVLAAVRDCAPHAVVTQWAPVTKAVVDELDHCVVISRIGIGLDVVDIAAAEQRGIRVMNVPDYCIEEVASHAAAMLMALARNLSRFDAEVRDGIWNAAASAGQLSRLSSMTLGLVGAGRIGRMVANALKIWGTTVVVYDPYLGDDRPEQVSLEELARRSDMISLHAPLTEENHHLIDAAFLSKCERRPIIVNTSRGGLIDADALAKALHNGTVRGAGLDVFESEPLAQDHPIRLAPNCILTPHAAWASQQALPDLRRGSIDNVVSALQDAAR